MCFNRLTCLPTTNLNYLVHGNVARSLEFLFGKVLEFLFGNVLEFLFEKVFGAGFTIFRSSKISNMSNQEC